MNFICIWPVLHWPILPAVDVVFVVKLPTVPVNTQCNVAGLASTVGTRIVPPGFPILPTFFGLRFVSVQFQANKTGPFVGSLEPPANMLHGCHFWNLRVRLVVCITYSKCTMVKWDRSMSEVVRGLVLLRLSPTPPLSIVVEAICDFQEKLGMSALEVEEQVDNETVNQSYIP